MFQKYLFIWWTWVNHLQAHDRAGRTIRSPAQSVFKEECEGEYLWFSSNCKYSARRRVLGSRTCKSSAGKFSLCISESFSQSRHFLLTCFHEHGCRVLPTKKSALGWNSRRKESGKRHTNQRSAENSFHAELKVLTTNEFCVGRNNSRKNRGYHK